MWLASFALESIWWSGLSSTGNPIQSSLALMNPIILSTKLTFQPFQFVLLREWFRLNWLILSVTQSKQYRILTNSMILNIISTSLKRLKIRYKMSQLFQTDSMKKSKLAARTLQQMWLSRRLDSFWEFMNPLKLTPTTTICPLRT